MNTAELTEFKKEKKKNQQNKYTKKASYSRNKVREKEETQHTHTHKITNIHVLCTHITYVNIK